MLTHGFFKISLNSKGQSIVEISLITPILLAALLVPADFGIALFTAHLTQNAVREAARIAVSDPTKSPFDNTAAAAVRTETTGRLPARLTSPDVIVRYYSTGAATPPATQCMTFVEVRAQGNYDIWFYQVLRLFGATVNPTVSITRTTRMWYQFQPVTNSGLCTGFTSQAP